MKSGALDRAEADCRRVLEVDADHPLATHYMGLILYRRGEATAAVSYLLRALDLAPESAEFHQGLASVLKNLGGLDQAAALYEQAIRRAPANPRAHGLLGATYRALGRLDQALESYRRAEALDPGDGSARESIDAINMSIALSRAMLDQRGGADGDGFACRFRANGLGRGVELRVPAAVVDFVQAYKNNLDARANAYNEHAFAGAFGAEGPVFPLYFAEWIYKDYLSIKDHLPAAAAHILDIGCGFGGLDLFLFWHYREPARLNFDLVEQRAIPGAQFSRPEPDAGAALDPLGCAVAFLRANGIAPGRLRTLFGDEADARARASYDLVVSMRSWCYLYPIATYLALVRRTLKPGGVLVVDVHKNLGGLAALRRHLPGAELLDDLQDLERCRYLNPPR